MRGKGSTYSEEELDPRITPAYAGKSAAPPSTDQMRRDHPRLCGEKQTRSSSTCFSSGSPPPMRGKATSPTEPAGYLRITPAYAGKSINSNPATYRGEDHPRLCGEKLRLSIMQVLTVGSPPPMRGKV